jgi:hypothetical protein
LLSWKGFFAGQIIFFSFLTLLYTLILTTDSPFSAAWSEGNRIWEYSTFFASNRYNTATTGRINTLTDIGRTSLWGIPFLISNISIKWVRIWSIFVFSVPYMIFGWVAFGFEKKKNLTAWAVLGIATYLFFNEAPIYTPLALAALLVALTRKSSLWLAVPVLILASYYVTTSRYTWIFAPGMWAVTCAFLDQDFSLQPGIWANWKKSILLGISALFGGLVIPPLVNPFLSSSHASAGSLTLDTFQEMGSDHPLMWDRLFPNPTHGQGILLNLTIVTLPLILLILLPIFTKKWKLNVWQKLVLFGFPALFLAVGLVISTKVGGGGNLHNLDMFFISLLFLLVLSWNHGLREMIFSANPNNKWAFALIFAFILAPAWATMKDVRPITHIVPQSEIDEALAAVVSQVEHASQKGSVLFIDQRQLITFGEVGYLPLVTEYEKKVLMNAAMANNESYFERYYNDLKSRRFSLIVTEPITINFQSAQQAFQYENNAWVKWVSIPTTCYYESIYRSDEFRIELLVPREKFLRYANGYRCPE